MATLVLGAALNSGGLLAWLMIGLIAGFLASTVMREGGYGMKGTSTLSEISLAYMRRSSSFALHQVLSPLKDHPFPERTILWTTLSSSYLDPCSTLPVTSGDQSFNWMFHQGKKAFLAQGRNTSSQACAKEARKQERRHD